MSSLVPTAISVGWPMRATSASLSSSREPTMQAARARLSLRVWSAKARKVRPRAWSMAAGSAASKASAIGSQSPTPLTRPMPSPPSTSVATLPGSDSAMKAETRAPIE